MEVRKNMCKWILPVLCLLWVFVIFLFSLRPGLESAEQSADVQNMANRVMEWLRLPLRFSDHFVRKAAHFTEFFVLGVLAALSAFSLSTPSYFSFAFSVFIASLDEFLQRFVPGRSASLWDVLLDSVGGICGAAAVLLIAYPALQKRKRSKK